MKALFIELPAFQKYREDYLNDETFKNLQAELLKNPAMGDLIQGTGGLRKVRFPDSRRGKGKRGGLRIIYYWWIGGAQFWLFTIYDKDEADDLTADQRKVIKTMLEAELEKRTKHVE